MILLITQLRVVKPWWCLRHQKVHVKTYEHLSVLVCEWVCWFVSMSSFVNVSVNSLPNTSWQFENKPVLWQCKGCKVAQILTPYLMRRGRHGLILCWLQTSDFNSYSTLRPLSLNVILGRAVGCEVFYVQKKWGKHQFSATKSVPDLVAELIFAEAQE